jgi:hypothetical protein
MKIVLPTVTRKWAAPRKIIHGASYRHVFVIIVNVSSLLLFYYVNVQQYSYKHGCDSPFHQSGRQRTTTKDDDDDDDDDDGRMELCGTENRRYG